jgi:UDP-2-acetamido-3-amino-2,3-dideoxy-glucuronate N-acetyltransferase
VVCGHSIGEYAFIAAGAVIACDVPAFALMMGVPARRKGWMCRCGVQLKGSGSVTCEQCESQYKITEETCTLLKEASE